MIFKRIEKFIERQKYKMWRGVVEEALGDAHPIIVYPFMMWFDLEAPKIFEEHGFEAVRKAAKDKLAEINDRTKAMLDEVAEAFLTSETPWRE
jgi:hypothetical protein